MLDIGLSKGVTADLSCRLYTCTPSTCTHSLDCAAKQMVIAQEKSPTRRVYVV